MNEPAPANTSGAGARGKLKISAVTTTALLVGTYAPHGRTLIAHAVGAALWLGSATLAARAVLQVFCWARPSAHHPLPTPGVRARQRRSRARTRLRRLMVVEVLNTLTAGGLAPVMFMRHLPGLLLFLGLGLLSLETVILPPLFDAHARLTQRGHVQSPTAAFRSSRAQKTITRIFESLGGSMVISWARDHSPWRIPPSETAASVFAAGMITVTFWTALGLDTAALATVPRVREVVIAVATAVHDGKDSPDDRPSPAPPPSPSASPRPSHAPVSHLYRIDCADDGIPGHAVGDTHAAERLDALYEGSARLKISAPGASRSGCGDGGHMVPTPAVGAYYAIGRCGSVVRSLAVTGPDGTGLLLHDAARYALHLATSGQLTGVDPLYKVGTGDAYVLHTMHGDEVLARQGYTVPGEPTSTAAAPCIGVPYAAQGYVAVFGAAMRGWSLIAQHAGRVWPVVDATSPRNKPAWIFFSNNQPHKIEGRVTCTGVRATTCTVRVTGGAVKRVTGDINARTLFQNP